MVEKLASHLGDVCYQHVEISRLHPGEENIKSQLLMTF